MMKKSIIYTLLLTGIIFISGCQLDNPENSISAEDFLKLEETSESIIVDVRTDSEYQAGHVENAILISLHNPDFMDKIGDLDKDKTYYVYCKSGLRSRSAVLKMKKEGFSKVYNIRGGINDLTRNGLDPVK
jgi:rhodanese-related sulfurtransferase